MISLVISVILCLIVCIQSSNANIAVAAFLSDFEHRVLDIGNLLPILRKLDPDFKLFVCVNDTTPHTALSTYLPADNNIEVLRLQSLGTHQLTVNPYFDCLATALIQQAESLPVEELTDSNESPVVVMLPQNCRGREWNMFSEFLHTLASYLKNSEEEFRFGCIAHQKKRTKKKKKDKKNDLRRVKAKANICLIDETAAPLLAVSSRYGHGYALQNLIQNSYEQELFDTSSESETANMSNGKCSNNSATFVAAGDIVNSFLHNYVATVEDARVTLFPSVKNMKSTSEELSVLHTTLLEPTGIETEQGAATIDAEHFVNLNYLNLQQQLQPETQLVALAVSMPRVVYDIFPYFDEFTLVRARMDMLSGVVHKFIIIESEFTHTGVRKQEHTLFLHHVDQLTPNVKEKIIHVMLKLPHTPAASNAEVWENERFQRNYLANLLDGNFGDSIVTTWTFDCEIDGVEGKVDRSSLLGKEASVPGACALLVNGGDSLNGQLSAVSAATSFPRIGDADLVVISDADELPKASAIFRAAQLFSSRQNEELWAAPGVFRLSMAHYLYNLTTPMGNFLTRHPYIAQVGYLRKTYHDDKELWHSFASSIRVGDLEPGCSITAGLDHLDIDRQARSIPADGDCVLNIISQGGWHLSNVKAVGRIRYKLNSVAHQEFNSAIVRQSLASRISDGVPAEFGFDAVSRAHAKGNVFLKQRRRPMHAFELRDFEYQQLVLLWNLYATDEDIAVGSDSKNAGETLTLGKNRIKGSFSERIRAKKQELHRQQEKDKENLQ